MTDLFYPHPHSLLLLLLPLFLFFLITIPVQSNNISNPNCHSYMCGNVNISYPFWKMDNEPASQFCGYPGFGVKCSEPNNPEISLGLNWYHVKNITYDNFNSIILIDKDVVTSLGPGPNYCPRLQHGINLETLPFNFSMYSVNLSFHYNCNGSPPFATEMQCSGDPKKKSYVHVVNRTEETDWDVYMCDHEVETTVLNNQLDRSLDLLKFDELLRNGFELQWRSMDACEKCEESGGWCGHHDGLLCFCSDGTTSRGDCKASKVDWKRKLLVGIGSAVLAVLVTVAVLYVIWRQCQKKRRSYGSSYRSRNISSYTSSMTDPEKNGAYYGVQIFKYRELEKATNYFDSRNELGDGGFGTVYQGKLKDGRVVAVKRLYENNYKRVEQFMNEVEILSGLRHRNLVSLYGCTTHHSRELLLVYEYISNGTVADHLHGEKAKPGSLTWTTRMSIAIETASALVYLHASDVVHRDVKTNNILLDNSFTVKVADFGLSRLFPNNVTHVSTAPQGTPGYVDPEYHECYQLTNKSDVYSFGVVLVELISSKPAVDITRHRHEINLSSMALSKIQNDALHELVDPHLGYETDVEVRKMINAVAELAFQCLQNERDSRPSMDEVLDSLMGIQNVISSSNRQDVLDGTCDDAVLLNHSQDMSPDSVAVAWSTSTMSTSSG